MKTIYHNGLCMDTFPDCLCMSCENDGRREGFSCCEQNDPYMKHCPMTICANYKAAKTERPANKSQVEISKK